MRFHYRIRAFVEGVREEIVILSDTLGGALDDYKGILSDDIKELPGLRAIQIAMVHQVSFGETGPVFEDVTHRVSREWQLAPFDEAVRFYEAKEVVC